MGTPALAFHENHFDIVDRSGQPWLRLPQIGVALGYANPYKVQQVYDRNADEFTDNMTAVVELDTNGGKQQVRIFSLRGCHLLAMFARTKVAKEFRRWVLDVLDSLNQPAAQPHSRPDRTRKMLPGGLTLEQQDAVKALVKSRVDALPKERQGGAAITCWSSIKSKFQVKTYKKVPPEQFGEVLSLIARLPLEGEHIPASKPDPKPEPPPHLSHSHDYRRARERLAYLRGFAGCAFPENARHSFTAALDELERCLISGWTEIDEAMLRFHLGMDMLRRWKGCR
jgi:prophage antirepressor-like protein